MIMTINTTLSAAGMWMAAMVWIQSFVSVLEAHSTQLDAM